MRALIALVLMCFVATASAERAADVVLKQLQQGASRKRIGLLLEQGIARPGNAGLSSSIVPSPHSSYGLAQARPKLLLL